MEKLTNVDSNAEASNLLSHSPEGGLKELVMRWFTDTQASQILQNGNFPDWFQGFAARKDTEDLLRDKGPGCFLIRLSDKTIGYILSYKGHDRCRHFVITQNEQGQFTMGGDSQTYESLTELIEFFRVSPIQPFREYLTSSCYQVNGGELYDVVNSEKSGVSVLALRNLWDQQHGRPIEPANKPQTQQLGSSLPPPALPPKCKNRKLAGAVSVDTGNLAQVLPPVTSKSSSFTMSHPNVTQVDPKRSPSLRGFSNSDQGNLYPDDTEQRQVEDQSGCSERPNSIVDEDESSSSSPTYSPTCLEKVTCHTYSLYDPEPSSSEEFRSNPLYHSSSQVGSTQQGSVTYSEVPQRSTSTRRGDNPYEQIPKEPGGNTYESVEEMKTKKKSSWGKTNMKWLHFLPDSKKK